MDFAFAFCGTALVAALVLFMLWKTGLAWRIATDIPNFRSLHNLPVPRVGGWGMVPAWLLVLALLAQDILWLGGLVLLLAIVSYIDDRFGLSQLVRFPAHWLAAAGVLLATPSAFAPPYLVVAAFTMVWMTNLFNFMDGSDGLAGGMALFGFSGYGIIAGLAGDAELALAAAAASGAALGFLFFNFHPAKVFMGDAGSIPFGFLSGALGWLGVVHGIWPWWMPLFLFSPFVADATVTLVRRLARGEKVWQAHREHYYQRLVQMGCGHRNTGLIYYCLMAGVALTGVWLVGQDELVQILGIVAWGAIFVLGAGQVDRRWHRFTARSQA